MYSRIERIIGEEKLEKIKKSSVAVIGVGGVGGYIAEMLVRTGVQNITLVDFDKIDVSNINRQIIATTKNIGKYKVEEFKKRLLDINPKLNLTTYNLKITKQEIPKVIDLSLDFVIDAIDDIPAKVELIKYCVKNNINIISSMGTGNRYKTPQFEITDISKTSYDKLAKKLRKLLKDEGINNLPVCYTKEPVEVTDSLGSVVYYPLMCAGTITSYVINKILENKNK